jgi:hypothetical protein
MPDGASKDKVDRGEPVPKERRKARTECPHGKGRPRECRTCCRQYMEECDAMGVPVDPKKMIFCTKHWKKKYDCKECGGSSICPHGTSKWLCVECGGSSICPHGREKRTCKECKGKSICTHGITKYLCRDCGGASICSHGKQRTRCVECGGSSICSHGKIKYSCKSCRLERQAAESSKAAKEAGEGGADKSRSFCTCGMEISTSDSLLCEGCLAVPMHDDTVWAP